MDEIKKIKDAQKPEASEHRQKKPYTKPTVQSDKVFEAQALACEKCDVAGPTFSCIGVFSS